MKTESEQRAWIFAAVTVLTCAAAFVTGYSARGLSREDATSVIARATRAEEGGRPAEPTRAGANSAAKESVIRERAGHILQITNRLERLREITHLLGDVTGDNWRPLMDDLIPEMERRGWGNYSEYRTVLNRIGAVAGAAALEESLAERDERTNSRARHLLAGWSAAQPRLALEWMNRPPPKSSQTLWDAVAFGMSRVDPELAFTTLKTRTAGPGGTMMIYYTIEGAIELGGLRRAEELYTWAMRQDFKPEFLQVALHNLATKHVEAVFPGESPERMLNWFSKLFPIDPNTRAGGGVSRTVIGIAAAMDPRMTLGWLDARADQLDADTAKASYTAWAEAWQSAKLEEFLAWVEASPEHPQHTAIVAQGIKSLLIRDDPARARSLLQTVKDADAKAKLAATIGASEAKAAATKRER